MKKKQLSFFCVLVFFFQSLDWVWELLVFIQTWQSTLPLPVPPLLLFLLHTADLPQTFPASPSVPVCLFVNTVQSLRPCKLPPSSTSCLPLFHHPSYPNHLPSSPSLKKKKTNLSVSLEKEISLQFHYLNLWNDGIRLCTLTFWNSSKMENEIKQKDLSFSAWFQVCSNVEFWRKNK